MKNFLFENPKKLAIYEFCTIGGEKMNETKIITIKLFNAFNPNLPPELNQT